MSLFSFLFGSTKLIPICSHCDSVRLKHDWFSTGEGAACGAEGWFCYDCKKVTFKTWKPKPKEPVKPKLPDALFVTHSPAEVNRMNEFLDKAPAQSIGYKSVEELYSQEWIWVYKAGSLSGTSGYGSLSNTVFHNSGLPIYNIHKYIERFETKK